MLKKIILICLICILVFIAYIAILLIMSKDSIMDKDGMVYKNYDNANVNNEIE